MSDVTQQINNDNMKSFDYDFSKIFIFSNRFGKATFKNNTGVLDSFPVGTILGRDSSDNTIVPLDSAVVTNGADIPIGVLAQPITDLGIAGTVTDINFCLKGDVAEEKIVFDNGADTVATAVTGGRTIGDHLADRGVMLIETTQLSDYDNA